MPVILLRLILTLGLAASLQFAYGQADLAVSVQVLQAAVQANSPTKAIVLVTNEGSAQRLDLQVDVSLSPSLFYVLASPSAGSFDAEALKWRIPTIQPGRTDTLELELLVNSGGIHTISAELMRADGDDWDSTLGNHNSREDDQDDACLTVPIQLACGQYAVLRAPSGKTGYAWFRNDTLLAYAKTDTLHPSRTGDYRYVITGETCASGACCPVRIDRAGCIYDLALLATATPIDLTSQFQKVTLRIYNEGAAPVSRAAIYVTTSKFMRLSTNVTQLGWQLAGDRMRHDWTGVLAPGDSTSVSFDIQSIAGGAVADYTMFAEIEKFYSGLSVLKDFDSTPDDNVLNDNTVDNGRKLAASVDEDDSDIVKLTNCPSLSVTGNQAVCVGESLTLKVNSSTAISGATYRWTGDATFSCRDCASPRITVTRDVEVAVEVTSEGGCVFREKVQLRTKTCTQEMLVVVSPYSKASQCVPVAVGTSPKWCIVTPQKGVTMSNRPPSNTEVCIEAVADGNWAGTFDPCLEFCIGTSCAPVKLKVLALPRRDVLTIGTDGKACLKPSLQVETAALSSRVLGGTSSFKLVDAGSNCFSLTGQPTIHAATVFTVIHEYQLAGRAVYDTTVVNVPARQTCLTDVLADAGYTVDADPATGALSREAYACISGSLETLKALKFSFAGQTLVVPSVGCEPTAVAKFSLRGLPAGYPDNGWRIERYVVAGVQVITNQTYSSLAAVTAAIRAVDPTSAVIVDTKIGSLEVAGFTKAPERLALRHLASNTGLSVQPIVINGFKGWRLLLPAGTKPGTYELLATNAEGCTDRTNVIVKAASTVLVQRDTVRVRGELAEPLYVGNLKTFTPPSGSTWTALAEGYVSTFDRTGVQNLLFVDATASPRRERLVIATIADRVCAPLVHAKDVMTTGRACDAQTVPLGLTRPDLVVLTTSGRITSSSLPTGSRPGAVYKISDLANRGLTARYTVTSWPGLAKATGLTGNLAEILSAMRSQGLDAYANWTTGFVYVATATGQPVSFSVSGSANVSWTPSATQLDTYGALYGRPGSSTVTATLGTCRSEIAVSIKCPTRVPVPGGIFVINAGSGIELPRTQITGAVGAASMTLNEVPTGIWAELDPNGGGLVVKTDASSVGDYQVAVDVCDVEGNCQVVQMTLRVEPASNTNCTVDIWRDETDHLVVAPGTPGAVFYIPSDFNADTDQILIDGKPAGAALSNKSLGVERVYEISSTYSELRTPSGKTIAVQRGDVQSALAQVFAEAKLSKSGAELRLKELEHDERIFGRDAAGIWAELEPLVIRDETRAVLALTPGEHVVELLRGADANGQGGCRDRLAVKVELAPSSAKVESIAVIAGETQTYCLPEPRKGMPVLEIVNDCEANSGERVTVQLNKNCVTLEGVEAGQEKVCLRRVYLDGGVDSLRLLVDVSAQHELTARADRDSIEFGQFMVVEVLANDLLSDEPRSLSLISEPYFGRAQVVGNSAIEYLHYGGDCAKDVFTYEICQGDVCQTATVELEVFCDELLVYNGLSPNGDGVNEEFTILGLGQYPKHEITVFNREGNVLAVFRDYANDWRGTIGADPLAEGTYFYVIDLGNGETRSGYLQLTR